MFKNYIRLILLTSIFSIQLSLNAFSMENNEDDNNKYTSKTFRFFRDKEEEKRIEKKNKNGKASILVYHKGVYNNKDFDNISLDPSDRLDVLRQALIEAIEENLEMERPLLQKAAEINKRKSIDNTNFLNRWYLYFSDILTSNKEKERIEKKNIDSSRLLIFHKEVYSDGKDFDNISLNLHHQLNVLELAIIELIEENSQFKQLIFKKITELDKRKSIDNTNKLNHYKNGLKYIYNTITNIAKKMVVGYLFGKGVEKVLELTPN